MSRRSQSKARLRFAASRNLRGSQRRRGVILIVVVGLMALFALVGITFVITAEQANRGAQSAAEVERYEDPPETLLQRAFLQVLVGSKNRFSSIGPNSLLEDMYGPGLIAPIPANGFVSGPVAGSANFSMGNAGAGGMMYIRNLVCKANGGAFSNSNAAYNGQVITMLTGAAAGKSSRITGYAVDASSGTATTATLRLLPFPGMTYAGPGWSDVGAPKIGDLFVINSRPFNGTGAGYVPGAGSGGTLTTGLLNEPLRMISRNATSNAALSGNPIDIGGSNPMLAALAINARDPEVRRYLETASAQGYLQLDEDYDAPDFQNPHLALYVNSTGGNFVAAPSYHRPEVLYYYANLLAGAYMGLPADPGAETIMNADALLQADLTPVVRRVFRKLTPRPLKQDHPGMADVNPAFTLDWDGTSAANARWDVDNDGDGVPDSIWMDLGFDVQSDAQGRLYKPLVAIHCRDLDGKLNLNAHGQNNDYEYARSTSPVTQPQIHTAQLSRDTDLDPNILPARSRATVGARDPVNSAADLPIRLPASGAMSPADVSLAPLFTLPFGGYVSTEFMYLLHGRATTSQTVAGRYGEPTKFGSTPAAGGAYPYELPGPGLSTGTVRDDNFPPPAMHDVGTNLSTIRYNVAAGVVAPAGNSPQRFGYQMPLDLDGNGAVAVGFDGQPVFYAYGSDNITTTAPEAYDEAFELDLNNPSRYGDAPFSPQDLEWLLRPYDVDQTTSKSRLASLVPSIGGNAYARGLTTTESWDLPTPSIQCTPEIRYGLNLLLYGATMDSDEGASVDPTFADLIRGKIAAVNAFTSVTETSAVVDARARELMDVSRDVVAPELMLGTRLDINRPLGNNYDDDNQNGIDDPGEFNEQLWGPSGTGTITDRNGDGLADTANMYPGPSARLARHLYFLTMLLTDWKYAEWSEESGLDEAKRRELTIRRVAQWAVNVADARDPDLIMTAFEYDANPWNGWDVDGDHTTIENTSGTPHVDRRVVWGCETPTLLITETTAFHDVRLKDLDTDNVDGETTRATPRDPANEDDDPDSVRIPQGSAFIELYCPLNQQLINKMMQEQQSQGVTQTDLFYLDGSNWKLDLGRMTAAGTEGRHPTWRLVVSESSYGAPADPDQDVAERLKDYPDSASIEVEPYPGLTSTREEPTGSMTFSMLPGSTDGRVKADRIVWLANSDPDTAGITDAYKSLVYYNRGTQRGLAPGEYGVVGPQRSSDFGGTLTRIGYSTTRSQSFDLAASFMATKQDGTQVPYSAGDQIKSPVSFPCAFALNHPGAMGTDALGPIGFSISEPRPRLTMGGAFDTATYYDAPSTETIPLAPAYGDGLAGDSPKDMYSPPRDAIQDATAGYPLVEAGIITPGMGGNLKSGANVLGLHTKFKTVFLQRIANPTIAYSHTTNPYITVDWMDIDLRVFNGEDNKWSEDVGTVQNDGKFCTRQRGWDDAGDADGDMDFDEAYPVDGTAVADVTTLAAEELAQRFDLLYNRAGLANADATTVGSNNFNLHMSHTLGYLNRTYHTRSPSLSATADWLYETNAFTGDASLTGLPYKPFRWIPFFNRPFISPMELLLVPSSSPSRLGWECTPYSRDAGVMPQEFYAGRRTKDDNDPTSYRGHGPFGHTLNFFYASQMRQADFTAVNTSGLDYAHAAGNYHRIFEYIHVPSRFSGTQQMLNPSVFHAGSTSQKATQEFYPFFAPFNLLPTYREPGRVNLNTVFDTGLTTWLAVTNAFGDRVGPDGTEDNLGGTYYATRWQEVFRSRKGRQATSATDLRWSTTVPTRLTSPFRSFSSSSFVPLAAMTTEDGTVPFGANEATLLRPQRAVGADAKTAEPLFRFNSHPTLYSTPNGVLDEFNNSDRNPSFRFDLLNKLSNVVTNRSNVYAVWATIGYFEVERAIPGSDATSPPLGANVPTINDENFDGFTDALDYWTVYPDGYTYKGELGADTGEIKRHRGFWIVDRTIPVGFERGEAHNAMDAVILQRVLE